MTVAHRGSVFLTGVVRGELVYTAWSRRVDAQWLADQLDGPVGGVGVAAASAPPVGSYRWPGFMVRPVVAEAGDEPGTLGLSKPLLVPELLRPTRRPGDVPTTVAPAGAVPTGGSTDRDPGRTVLGVAPFAIADGDGLFPDPESRPGSGELAIPTANEPRPVRLAAIRRLRRWLS